MKQQQRNKNNNARQVELISMKKPGYKMNKENLLHNIVDKFCYTSWEQGAERKILFKKISSGTTIGEIKNTPNLNNTDTCDA